jgi:ABC-type bacteriocin/lantibiotic exporter with double-glycine peptidase domain
VPRNLLTVRHIQPRYSADCLAACAAMLLTYINVQVPYERLLRILNVQSFGASGRNLYRLSQLGVEVVYREGAMSILEEIIGSGRPCIALAQTGFLQYWTYSTEHAVIVVGIDGDSVYLNDPAFAQHPMITTGSTLRA